MEPGDAERVAAHRGFVPGDAVGPSAYATWLAPRIAAGAYVGRLAVAAQGRVVGGAGVVLLDWGPTRGDPCGTMARVVNVFTDEGWRRRGIASALLHAVIAQCEATGVREFSLAATPDAVRLYASLGFAAYPAEMRRSGSSA